MKDLIEFIESELKKHNKRKNKFFRNKQFHDGYLSCLENIDTYIKTEYPEELEDAGSDLNTFR